MIDRATALRVLAALRRSPIGDAAILIGSFGLVGFDSSVPEDVDVSVPEPLIEALLEKVRG